MCQYHYWLDSLIASELAGGASKASFRALALELALELALAFLPPFRDHI